MMLGQKVHNVKLIIFVEQSRFDIHQKLMGPVLRTEFYRTALF